MQSEVKLFENAEFGKVRVVMLDSEPWFAAKDVALALGYTDTDQAIRVHCNYAKLLKPVETTGLGIGPRGMYFIPESDVYALIFRSNLKSAAAFRAWVCEDVLPSIRKTGSYIMPGMPDGKRPLCDIAAIFSAAGVTGNQLALALDNVYKAETGMSVLAVAGIQLVSPVQEHLFTPTELGGMLGGLSGKTVNRMLADAGLQYRLPDGKWVLTELGKQYGIILDTGKKHLSGAPVTQLKWYRNVLDTIDAK